MTRFDQAFALATDAHLGQVRKVTKTVKGLAVPYITHRVVIAPLGVLYGDNEHQFKAALLHDVPQNGRQQPRAWPVEAQLGARVMPMVRSCTESEPGCTGSKAPGNARDVADMAHLVESAGDKLQNLTWTSAVDDLRELGAPVFERCTAGKEQTIWCYTEFTALLDGRVRDPIENAIQSGRVNSSPLGAFSLQENVSETYASHPLDTPYLWGGAVHSELSGASERGV